MAYGYNNNPYNQYNYNQNGYGGYQQQMPQYPQTNYQQMQSYQPYQAQPQQQMIYHPLTFVNGIEGAKAFIVNPNQTIYLKDSDSDMLYVKTADAQGRCELKSFVLSTTESNNNQKPITPINYVTKEDLVALKDEIIKVIKGGDVSGE